MSKKKAFTLVELLVAMAIIAILIGLAVFGINLVNRNARDTQRRAAVNDIYSAITDYYNRKGGYPAVIQWTATDAIIRESGTGNCPTTPSNPPVVCIQVPLNGPAKPAATTPGSGSMAAYTTQPPDYTAITGYCYKTGGTIGARLESGDFVFAGGTTCP